jgi:Bacterial type II/III secretion system short domain
MSKGLLLMMLLAASSLMAQEAAGGGTPPPSIVRLVHLKYADANNARSLFGNTGVSVTSDGVLNSIVLRGEPKTVEEVERLIHEVDVPESARPAKYATANLEFQVYVVAGGDTLDSEHPLPKILEPAVSQIKSMFPFRGYRLLETIQNRVRAGDSVSSSGTLAGLAPGPGNMGFYALNISTTAIASPNDPIGLHFKFEASGRTEQENKQIKSTVETAFSVSPGQLVVVGKSGYGEASLFLIMSARAAN